MTETPEAQPPGANVPGYLFPLSILATILFLPVGILSIVFSAQARSKSEAGDYAGASQAVRHANVSLIAAVVLGVLSMILIFAFGLLGNPGATGEGEGDIVLEDLVQEQAGVFRLQGVEEFPEGIQLGAEDALTATYEDPDGASLINNLLDMPSFEEADELRQQRVQEQQGELDLRVAGEEPVENEEEEQIGTVTVLTREAAGSTVTVVSWTNEDLYSEAISGGTDAETFFREVDY
jgi:hypothetical protein